MNDAFGNWLAGFVDGEGTFSLVRTNKDTYAVHFAIKLRADDAPILRTVRRELGCGHLSLGANDGLISKSPYVRYAVTSIKDIVQKVIPAFERFPLRAKKRRDFEIFREAAYFIYQIGNRKQEYLGYLKGRGPKWTDGDRTLLDGLRLLMIDTRTYNDQEYTDHLSTRPCQLRILEPYPGYRTEEVNSHAS